MSAARNDVLLDGAIMLTHCPPSQAALLTVRGKDHDLTAEQMLELAAALIEHARRTLPPLDTRRPEDADALPLAPGYERGGA